MKLRLLLGDQLNYNHSWFTTVDANVIYFMAEMRQETDYVTHHIQKIVAFFKSMRNFSEHLQKQGHHVIYYSLDHPKNKQSLTDNLAQLIKENQVKHFEYQLPDEYRLDQQLQKFCNSIKISSSVCDTEHFLTNRTDLAHFFEGKKQYTMEFFYRYMRKRFHIMMVNDKDPEGGKWNFDHNNRNKWKGAHLIPIKKDFFTNVTPIENLVKENNIKTIGSVDSKNFTWPTNRKECLETLDYFCKNLLIHFGDYQDAMHTNEYYLFHSNLSFALNTKQLHPKEVVDKAIHYWRKNKDIITISQIEGFVRQIIGWREYMRGIYWLKMPNYAQLNELANHNPLPDFYWTGTTKMNCLKHCITQSLKTGYAHHIQRLMITGNYALLTQTHPDQVDQWYLGIYNDAIEWVEITNTRGMSQFADGGVVATKPYISSGSYINKMSNYCKGCHYKVSQKTTENACPFNSLYWNFLDEKRLFLNKNQRMSMMYRLLDKMDSETLVAHKKRAQHIIANPNDY
ncbi:cryptochrome/photolyase family protein [Aquimarina agarilytica]|uniref:cryptochrome/photolyase family protein n=1 Tax=Aquimarina agarilytica TaxID=1087449 RepID=UPI0002886BF9|nr:cryptochrome/photolyase family protein [Aquimarina agarilytica]